MTDIDIIKNAIDVLSAISAPISLTETVILPIYQVRRNLKALYEVAIEQQKKKEEHQLELSIGNEKTTDAASEE